MYNTSPTSPTPNTIKYITYSSNSQYNTRKGVTFNRIKTFRTAYANRTAGVAF